MTGDYSARLDIAIMAAPIAENVWPRTGRITEGDSDSWSREWYAIAGQSNARAASLRASNHYPQPLPFLTAYRGPVDPRALAAPGLYRLQACDPPWLLLR